MRGPRWRAACALAGLVGLVGLVGGAAGAQVPCGAALAPERRQQLSVEGLHLAYAPSAWPVPAGQFFTLEVVLCEPAGTGRASLVSVDATMPAHRHGMNYRPRILARGEGRFGVEGLLLHMPGRWRLNFTVGQGGQTRQVSHEVDVP